MNAISISRKAMLVFVLVIGAMTTGCAVVPQGNSTVRADVLTGTNVPIREARRALSATNGVVQDVIAVTIADPRAATQNRVVGATLGGVVGFVAAEALKVAPGGKLAGLVLGSVVGGSLSGNQMPQVRTAEQVVVRFANGRSVVVVQELEMNGKPMAIGEAVIVVAGPSTTRVVRQTAAVAVPSVYPQP